MKDEAGDAIENKDVQVTIESCIYLLKSAGELGKRLAERRNRKGSPAQSLRAARTVDRPRCLLDAAAGRRQWIDRAGR